MNRYSNFRFILGILLHPSQVWLRIREFRRIAFQPPRAKRVPTDKLPDVELIPVLSDKSHQDSVVALYRRNPSPYLHGPKSIEQLQEALDRGIRYFLVRNNDGEYVGARAFDPTKNMMLSAVSDYRHRGRGYNLASGLEIRRLLASEGCTELRSNVMRSNIRVQRALRAAGWTLKPHPENPDLVRATIRLDS